MADSQKVENSNSGSTKEEITDFHRRLPYDPAMLKRRKLYNPSQLKSSDFFGKMGVALGHQGAHAPGPKHTEGDTQKYNGPSESRSHGARSNNGAGVSTTSGGHQEYPSQPLHRGSGGLDNASSGLQWNSSSRSHGSRDNGGAGVRDAGKSAGAAAVQYPRQSLRRGRAVLHNTQNGLKYNGPSESRSHGERDN